MDIGTVVGWLRSSAWIANWMQLAITVAVAGIDLYVVFIVLFRQILGPTPAPDRPALGRALASFAKDQVASEKFPSGFDDRPLVTIRKDLADPERLIWPPVGPLPAGTTIFARIPRRP